MKLSIIVPTLNEAEGIIDTLQTLKPLRDAGHQIIVSDGGSGDATCALAAPMCDRLVTAAKGRARQMNGGAQIADGNILLFLHADTRLPEGAADLIINGIQQGHGWGRFDVRLSGRHPLLRLIGFMMNLRSRLSGIATGDQAIFIERSLFDTTGGFADIALMEDIAMSRTLKSHSRPCCLDAKVTTSSRRWEQRGIWRTLLLMWRLRLSYFFGGDPERLARLYGRG